MASLEVPRKITTLDAINIILQNAGESPVTTSGPNSRPSAQKARELLSEESVSLQSEGHNFSTVRRLKLDPDVNGRVYLPDNILSFIPTGVSRYTELHEDEDNKIIDASTGSDKFTSAVFLEVVMANPFESLPQPARWLIAVKAAVRFVNSENPGSQGLRLNAEDVSRANAAFLRYDARLRRGGLRAHNPFIKRMRGNR